MASIKPQYYSLAANARGRCCLFGWAIDIHVGQGTITRFQDNRVRTRMLIVVRFQQGIIAEFPNLVNNLIECGKAAGGSIAGMVRPGEVITEFLEPTVIAQSVILANRVKVSAEIGHLRDKRAVDAALRASTDRSWDATDYIPAAAAIGIAHAVTAGLLSPSRGNYIGHSDGSYTDTRLGGRTYGPGGQVNF